MSMLRTATGAPARVVYITLARAICDRATRAANGSLVAVIAAWLTLLGVSTTLAQLTSKALAPFGSVTTAFFVSALLHMAVGVSVHLYCLPLDDPREHRHRVAGILGLAVGGMVLVVLAVLRVLAQPSTSFDATFRSVTASFGLLLLEVLVAGLAGYVLYMVSGRYKTTRRSAAFYQDLALRVETDAWEEAWDHQVARLQQGIDELERRIPDETPEEVFILVREVRRLQCHLAVLQSNHPNRALPHVEPHHSALVTVTESGRAVD